MVMAIFETYCIDAFIDVFDLVKDVEIELHTLLRKDSSRCLNRFDGVGLGP